MPSALPAFSPALSAASAAPRDKLLAVGGERQPTREERQATVQRLMQALRQPNLGSLAGEEGVVRSSGSPEWDRWLPWRGWTGGKLIEWLGMNPGAGATTLALLACRQWCGDSGYLAVVDPRGDFYPPAAARWGLDLRRLLLIRPGTVREMLWGMDQLLRCEGLSAVLAWPGWVDPHAYRRWQLAVEQSGVLGCLIRPPHAQGEVSWADLRLGVWARPGQPRDDVVGPDGGGELLPAVRNVWIQALYRRGGARMPPLELQIHDESQTIRAQRSSTSDWPVAAELAHSAGACRTTEAS